MMFVIFHKTPFLLSTSDSRLDYRPSPGLFAALMEDTSKNWLKKEREKKKKTRSYSALPGFGTSKQMLQTPYGAIIN